MHFEALENFEWYNDPENVRFENDVFMPGRGRIFGRVCIGDLKRMTVIFSFAGRRAIFF